MINDVVNTAIGQFLSTASISAEDQKLTGAKVIRADRDNVVIMKVSPESMKIIQQNLADFKEKNEIYAQARAEVMEAKQLSDEEFYRLAPKEQETIITSIMEKFKAVLAERMKEKMAADLAKHTTAPTEA